MKVPRVLSHSYASRSPSVPSKPTSGLFPFAAKTVKMTQGEVGY